MGRPKGSIKYGGRTKGTVNKKTTQWETFAKWFMTTGMSKLEREMGKLEGKDYVNTVKDLLEYFKPKLNRTELTGKDGESLGDALGITKTQKENVNELLDGTPVRKLGNG